MLASQRLRIRHVLTILVVILVNLTECVHQTTAVLATFLLTMTRYPTLFKKAQEEVDQVTGNGRLPDFDDRPSLPYLESVIKEIYR